MISRQEIFSDPDKSQVKLSPDQRYISYLAPHRGEVNLWIAPLEALDEGKPISSSEHPIRDYIWLPSGEDILYYHDYFGDENWQLSGYNLQTEETRGYTERFCQARILQLSRSHSDEILIALNERDKRYHDVYRLNLKTGEKRCVYENNQYWDFIADHDFECRVGIKINQHEGEYIDLKTGEVICKIAQHDLFGLYFYPKLKPVFSTDNQLLYIVQTNTNNTSTLTEVNIEKKYFRDLANHPKGDICEVLYHPKTKAPIAYCVNHDKKVWIGIDPSINQHLQKLNEDLNTEVDIVSQNREGDEWILSINYSHRPSQYCLYQHKNRDQKILFSSHENLEKYAFNPMQAIDIPMRDGSVCMSYLSVPLNRSRPYPLVMLIHGGPNYRDFWGFNSFHQWLTNRGYAVLSVNYRASTGFGRAHSEAGNGEWAGKIREDILDAADWAVKQGITQNDTIALFGRSFGGYQVLLGLTFTPERFCCGVDIVGPANLETMMRCFPPYWESMRGVLNDLVGCDPSTDEGKAFLKASSPLTFADKISRPLLIGHGMNDPRIQQAESDRMVAAMRENKIPVTYAVFSNEGHQISHPANRRAFYGLVEDFLAKHLQAAHQEPYDGVLPNTMKVSIA